MIYSDNLKASVKILLVERNKRIAAAIEDALGISFNTYAELKEYIDTQVQIMQISNVVMVYATDRLLCSWNDSSTIKKEGNKTTISFVIEEIKK